MHAHQGAGHLGHINSLCIYYGAQSHSELGKKTPFYQTRPRNSLVKDRLIENTSNSVTPTCGRRYHGL